MYFSNSSEDYVFQWGTQRILLCGMGVWSCKLGDKTYFLHVEDASCPISYKNFLNSYNVKRHLKSAHAPNTVKKKCDQCDATFTSDGALRHHVRLSHKRVLQLRMVIVKQCPECDKEIMKRNLLSQMKEVHKLTNYNTARAEVLIYAFKCEMCSFSTKRKHDLKRHPTICLCPYL